MMIWGVERFKSLIVPRMMRIKIRGKAADLRSDLEENMMLETVKQR